MVRKVLARIKGNGSFLDISYKNQGAMPDRPYVLVATSAVNMAASQGRLEILGDVKETCTDENFYKFYANEKDKNAAVVKYLKQKEDNLFPEKVEKPKAEKFSEEVKDSSKK